MAASDFAGNFFQPLVWSPACSAEGYCCFSGARWSKQTREICRHLPQCMQVFNWTSDRYTHYSPKLRHVRFQKTPSTLRQGAGCLLLLGCDAVVPDFCIENWNRQRASGAAGNQPRQEAQRKVFRGVDVRSRGERVPCPAFIHNNLYRHGPWIYLIYVYSDYVTLEATLYLYHI